VTHLAQQPALFPLHCSAGYWLDVVPSVQVQQAMDEITRHFILPRRSEPPRLRHRIVHANEDLALQ
jgi:hypothetical protein